MHNPYEWSTICNTCGRRYKLDEEGHFMVQRIGVDINGADGIEMLAKTEIEHCPLCLVTIVAEGERMAEK